MKFKVSLLIAALLFTSISIAQINYSDNNYSIEMTQLNDYSKRNEVLFANNEDLVLLEEFNSSTIAVLRYNRSTNKLLSETLIDYKTYIGQRKLIFDTIFHKGDNTILVLYKSYNSKEGNVELFFSIIDEYGVLDEPKYLTRFKSESKKNYSVKCKVEEGKLVIVAFCGSALYLVSINTIWINQNMVEEKKLTYESKGEVYYTECMVYDPFNERVYISSHDGFIVNAVGNFIYPKCRYLTIFDKESGVISSKKIDITNVSIFNLQISVNEKTGRVHLLGITGKKNSNKMVSVFIADFNYDKMELTKMKNSLFTDQVLNSIKVDRPNPNSIYGEKASLNFVGVYYGKNSFYAVYQNTNPPWNIGHLILAIEGGKIKMSFVPTLGVGKALFYVDNKDNLEMYSINKSKSLYKYYKINLLAKSTGQSYCLLKSNIDSELGINHTLIFDFECTKTQPQLNIWADTDSWDNFESIIYGDKAITYNVRLYN